MTWLELLLLPLAVTMVGFVLLWPISVWRRDASIVDFWWAPGFFVQCAVMAWAVTDLPSRGWLLLALVGLWSGRLAWVLISRRLREGSEDPRYVSLRAAWSPGFWWKSLAVVFVLQAVVQWTIALGPLVGIMSEPAPVGLLALIGCVIAMTGLLVETRADVELDRFKREADEGALCETGLRAHIRHPNYLGEIIFWIGIGLIVSEVSVIAALISPLVITGFLVWVSGAPMLDERLTETRPGYAAYKARVPGFLPRFPPAKARLTPSGRG